MVIVVIDVLQTQSLLILNDKREGIFVTEMVSGIVCGS